MIIGGYDIPNELLAFLGIILAILGIIITWICSKYYYSKQREDTENAQKIDEEMKFKEKVIKLEGKMETLERVYPQLKSLEKVEDIDKIRKEIDDMRLNTNPKMWESKIKEMIDIAGFPKGAIEIKKEEVKGVIEEDKIDETIKKMVKEEIQKYESSFGKFKTNPKSTNALYTKGLAFWHLKNYEEEVKCYDEILKINPKDAIAWYYRAWDYSLLNNPKESIESLNKAISLDNKFKEMAKRNKDFDNIRNTEEFKELIGK